jgi:hypothetical protein
MPEPSRPIPGENEAVPTVGSSSTSPSSIPQTHSQNDQQANEVYASLINYFQNQLGKYNDKQTTLATSFADHENRLTHVEDKIDENRTKLVETLGLFIALFTFISVEFSIFQRITTISQVLSLTFILAGLLILFVLVLDLVMRSSIGSENITPIKYFGRLFILTIILIVIGILIAFFIPTSIDKKIIKDKSDALNETNNKIASPSASIILNPTQ